MKRFLVTTSLLLSPGFALAAFNDVGLTTDAIIQVGSYTLNVTGSSAAIQSITVNSSNFSVTLASGSSIKISAASLNDIASDISTNVIADICIGSESSLSLSNSGVGTVTNTITPSATLCGNAAPSGNSGGSRSNGSRKVTPAAVPVVQSVPAVATFTLPLSFGIENSEVLALQKLLASLGFLKAVPSGYFGLQTQAALKLFQISKGIEPAGFVGPATRAALNGLNATVPTTASAPALSFSRNLDVGFEGEDVRMLQKYLNGKGYVIAASGPGSLGNETTRFGELTKAALIRFQKEHDILPAVGFFGPITRAFIFNN